jgi:hypothetical protein
VIVETQFNENMKKLLLNITAIAAFSFTSFAQSNGIEIRVDGLGNDISGGEHSIVLTPASPELASGSISIHFIVTNNTGSDQQWKITRKRISVPTTWTDQLCWPPSCFLTGSNEFYSTPNTQLNPAPISINGTHTVSHPSLVGTVEAEIKPMISIDLANAASAQYRYYVTDALSNAYLDSVDLTVNFTLGVSSLKQTPTMNVSPNPASDNVNISLGTTENGNIRILDVLGKVIYSESIYNGQKNINVSDFKNGVYFIMVEASGMKTTNRKLIVRH